MRRFESRSPTGLSDGLCGDRRWTGAGLSSHDTKRCAMEGLKVGLDRSLADVVAACELIELVLDRASNLPDSE